MTVGGTASIFRLDADAETEDTDKVFSVKSQIDADGNRTTILTMPNVDGEVTETKQGGTGIIMTGITETPLEDEDD